MTSVSTERHDTCVCWIETRMLKSSGHGVAPTPSPWNSVLCVMPAALRQRELRAGLVKNVVCQFP